MPNFIFLFQGEGENRSIGFQDVVQANLSTFADVDLIFKSNNYWIGDDVPCLTYGMRGHIKLNVQVDGPLNDVHAGIDGGVIDEPLHDLIRLLSPLTDQLPAEFEHNVRPVDAEEMALYRQIDLNVQEYEQQLGHKAVPREPEMILMKRWRYPTISITSVQSSIVNSSIIPKRASASVNVRTVPDQDQQQIEEWLVQFLHRKFKQMNTTNRLCIDTIGNISWWLGDIKTEFFQKAHAAIEKHWKMKPMYVREGGTSPNTSFLQRIIGAPCLHFPIGQASDRAHLQNERIRLRNLIVGKDVLTDFFSSIARK